MATLLLQIMLRMCCNQSMVHSYNSLLRAVASSCQMHKCSKFSEKGYKLGRKHLSIVIGHTACVAFLAVICLYFMQSSVSSLKRKLHFCAVDCMHGYLFQ